MVAVVAVMATVGMANELVLRLVGKAHIVHLIKALGRDVLMRKYCLLIQAVHAV